MYLRLRDRYKSIIDPKNVFYALFLIFGEYLFFKASTISTYKRAEAKTMIKGCQKNVVWIRSTESELFEEAYFIISDKIKRKQVSENDMVSEANRLIADRFAPVSAFGSEHKTLLPKKEKIKWFFIGLFSAVASFSLVCFII